MAEAISSRLEPSEPVPPTESVPQQSAAPPHPAAPQLPVVDLIGLRFSLQHLRLVGYGLMAVWLAELAGLLSAPDFSQIGSRLHTISQFLDLSPILLVAIGLISFQGGLRRSTAEILILPLLLTLLPLLSAFHFFLAPVTVANAVTLVHKQKEIGEEQIERIDRQIDRATIILRESDSIDTLLEGLQRIPGLQVRVPAKASVSDARREVRRSLQRERERVLERIRNNLSTTRDAFLRRAYGNAALAVVMGLLLWGLHQGAMREMEQAIPFLDWVLVQGEVNQNPQVLQELLRFQRACVALGWFALLERSLRLVRRVIRPEQEEEQEEDLRIETLEESQPPAAYPPPFEPGRMSILQGGRPRLFPFQAPPLAGSPLVSPEDDDEDAGGEEPLDQPVPFWERRRLDRDRRRAREALRRMADSDMFQDLQQPEPPPGATPIPGPDRAAPRAGEPDFGPDFDPEADLEADPTDPQELTPSELRARQRDLKRSREALRRLADPEFLAMMGHELPPGEELPPPPPPGGPLGRLWRWFVTHL